MAANWLVVKGTSAAVRFVRVRDNPVWLRGLGRPISLACRWFSIAWGALSAAIQSRIYCCSSISSCVCRGARVRLGLVSAGGAAGVIVGTITTGVIVASDSSIAVGITGSAVRSITGSAGRSIVARGGLGRGTVSVMLHKSGRSSGVGGLIGVLAISPSK